MPHIEIVVLLRKIQIFVSSSAKGAGHQADFRISSSRRVYISKLWVSR
jgi:hypothetical protein